MDTLYPLFKFLHIVAAVFWIGGIAAIGLLNARLARREDPTVLAATARQSRFFGAAVAGPAALVTLLAGIAMIAVSGMGFTLWMLWGFAAIVASVVLGATGLRRAGARLIAGLQAADGDRSSTAPLQRRLALLNTVNLLLLLSAVWAMVFKPTL